MAKNKIETFDQFADQVAGMFRDQNDFLSEKFEQIDERFEKVDERFDRMDDRFDKMDIRLIRVEDKLDKIDKRLTKVEKDVTWIKEILEKHTTMLKDLDQERVFIINRVTRLEKELELIKKQLKVA